MSNPTRSALVVGAGIVGLTTAWRLATAGAHVTLFDPAPGRGATWAAAGMIAPHAEIAPGERANFALQRKALDAWRQLSDDCFDILGRGVDIRVNGTLMCGWDVSDRRQVDQFESVAHSFGAVTTRVRRDEQSTLFAGISDRVTNGLLLEGDAWLDPDQAVAVLRAGLDALGVDVVTETVGDIDGDESGVRARSTSGWWRGDIGILATGALALPDGATPTGEHAVRPVRGMTLRIGGIDRFDAPTVRCVVRGRPFYMVSRPGGYCVIGASSEERAGSLVEVGELQRLLRDALDVVPELEASALYETRVGLRPASANLEPFFEEWPERRWAWSSGHFRHGVTLAPLSAQYAVDFFKKVDS